MCWAMDALTGGMGGRDCYRMRERMMDRMRDWVGRKGHTHLSLLRLTCCVWC
jgi:hypothetical protein